MRSVRLNSLDDLSVKEYTEIFERVKSIATMRPTKENVKIMQIMNKWQTEQSERFAKVWAINLLEDPNTACAKSCIQEKVSEMEKGSDGVMRCIDELYTEIHDETQVKISELEDSSKAQ